jgi:DNA-binding MarR family transcriptional regulator
MRTLGNLSEYLDKSLGLKCHVGTSEYDLGKALPIHLRKRFDLARLDVEENPCIVAVPKVTMNGSELKGAVQEMIRRFGKWVVLCMDSLDSIIRRTLVSSKTPFIVPDKQVYLPFLYMMLNDRGLTSSPRIVEDVLSPAAQLLLLYHMEVATLDGRSLKEVAMELGYSAKTVTVVLPELIRCGICSMTHGSREKRLHFQEEGKKLWLKAKPYLISPVKRVAYTDVLPSDDCLPLSFDSAMAHYSFLGQPSKETFAVSAKSDLLKQMILHPSEGIYRIEIWKYDPKKLSKCAYVDPLSLMLSYKDSDDERINKEIEQLESKIL